MATYLELVGLANNNTLLDRMAAAVAVQADVIRQESGATTNHANRVKWAKQAFTDPKAMAIRMSWAVLAANVAQTLATIQGASDSAILAAIAAAVDTFADGT